MIDIELLLSKVDILEYISQYSSFEKKNGLYWCCSPLSDSDTDPSFSVSVELQSFYDFSTRLYGDVLDFIGYYNNCTISKSIEILLDYCGIDGKSIDNLEIPQIISYFKKFKHDTNNEKQTNYKILSNDYLNRFDFKEEKFKDWLDEGIPLELIKKYNITYDSINNCIVIPIYDNDGNIVNLCNRTLKKNYKELGLSKYIYSFGWNSGGIDILWGYYFNKNNIENNKRIIIVEGIKSVLKLESFGYDNSVALLTSHLNKLQFKNLLSLDVKEYIFALDNGIKIKEDIQIGFLKRYGIVSFLHDYNNILTEKDSPCDKGKKFFDELYHNRHRLY